MIALPYTSSTHSSDDKVVPSVTRSSGAVRVAQVVAIVALMLLCPFKIVNGAEHYLNPGKGDRAATCGLDGTLVSSDVSFLRENVRQGCLILYLSSPGGDIETALALGRIIRNAEMSVVVRENGKCASACVFLYAGGVQRSPYGRVLIHRPYLVGSSVSFEATQQNFAEIGKTVKTYLREMNVSESLFDRMMIIAPEDAVPLTLGEMNALGLGLNDQVWLEYLDNKKAARAGMTKQGWLAKKKQTMDICGDIMGVADSSEELHARKKCWERRFSEWFVEEPTPQPGVASLAKEAAESGAVKQRTGFLYKEIKAGKGVSPKATDNVTIHYRAALADGSVFDSSLDRHEPVTFPLSGVIPCWTQGLQLMKPGGKALLVCPPQLAYGDAGSSPNIKGGATLVFEVELLSIEK